MLILTGDILAEEENLRKRPSSSLGGTTIEPYEEKKEFPKGKPPAYPYEEKTEEKIEKIKKKIEKIKEKPKPHQIHEKHEKKFTTNILPILAIILSLIAISLVLTQGIDKNELKGIASDLRALNNKQISINIPIESNLTFNDIPSNQLFNGKQIIPVYFEIPITQTMKGKDIRTGILMEVEINDNILVQGDITIDLTNSNVSLQLNKPAKAVGETTSIILVRDVYGNEISSIAERLDRLSE